MDTNFLNACACTLSRAFGYEPELSHNIINNLGGIDAVFRIPEKERDDLLRGKPSFAGRLSDAELLKSERELSTLRQRGVQFTSIADPFYPEALRQCANAPVFLYVKSGSSVEDVFRSENRISVVGTRDITPYGSVWCKRIVGAIAASPARPVIVSGLALGVDVTAHRQALEDGLPTIAVLPCGIDTIYPRQHVAVSQRILCSEGSALVTDYPPGTAPTAVTFLRRNRIIAGLAQSTILIESKEHGGGLITARMAFDFGRDVFALPGRVDDTHSRGCNALVAEKIAEPIVSLQTLGVQLGLGRFKSANSLPLEERLRSFYAQKLPPERLKGILAAGDAIRRERGISVEQLSSRLALSYSETVVLAGMLESDGFISMDLLQRCGITAKNV